MHSKYVIFNICYNENTIDIMLKGVVIRKKQRSYLLFYVLI